MVGRRDLLVGRLHALYPATGVAVNAHVGEGPGVLERYCNVKGMEFKINLEWNLLKFYISQKKGTRSDL